MPSPAPSFSGVVELGDEDMMQIENSTQKKNLRGEQESSRQQENIEVFLKQRGFCVALYSPLFKSLKITFFKISTHF